MDLDLYFSSRTPAVSLGLRRRASARERAEQRQDDRQESGLWNVENAPGSLKTLSDSGTETKLSGAPNARRN